MQARIKVGGHDNQRHWVAIGDSNALCGATNSDLYGLEDSVEICGECHDIFPMSPAPEQTSEFYNITYAYERNERL